MTTSTSDVMPREPWMALLSYCPKERDIILDAITFRPSLTSRLARRHLHIPSTVMKLILERVDDGEEYELLTPELLGKLIPLVLPHCEFFIHKLHELEPDEYLEAKLSLELTYNTRIPTDDYE